MLSRLAHRTINSALGLPLPMYVALGKSRQVTASGLPYTRPAMTMNSFITRRFEARAILWRAIRWRQFAQRLMRTESGSVVKHVTLTLFDENSRRSHLQPKFRDTIRTRLTETPISAPKSDCGARASLPWRDLNTLIRAQHCGYCPSTENAISTETGVPDRTLIAGADVDHSAAMVGPAPFITLPRTIRPGTVFMSLAAALNSQVTFPSVVSS